MTLTAIPKPFKAPYPGFPAPGIKCRCGHYESAESFYVDGFGQDLPAGHFRCPGCHWQWRRVRVPIYFRDGGFNRFEIKIETVENPVL